MHIITLALTSFAFAVWVLFLATNLRTSLSLASMDAFYFSDILFLLIPLLGTFVNAVMIYYFWRNSTKYGIIFSILSLLLGSFFLIVVMASRAG